MRTKDLPWAFASTSRKMALVRAIHDPQLVHAPPPLYLQDDLLKTFDTGDHSLLALSSLGSLILYSPGYLPPLAAVSHCLRLFAVTYFPKFYLSHCLSIQTSGLSLL